MSNRLKYGVGRDTDTRNRGDGGVVCPGAAVVVTIEPRASETMVSAGQSWTVGGYPAHAADPRSGVV